MEISTDYSDLKYEELPQDEGWETFGKVALLDISFLSISLLVPALVKKRNYRVQILNHAGGSAEPAQQIVQQEEVQSVPLEQLPSYHCTSEERDKVIDLFTNIADRDASLAYPWVAYRLHTLGNEIQGVHPFALLLSLPKDKIRKILRSGNPFKTTPFLNGIRDGVLSRLNRMDRDIPEFAQDIEKNPERIRQLIQARDWSGLAHYLFDLAP